MVYNDLHEINMLIRQFFKNQFDNHPEVSQPGILQGWLESFRVEHFQNTLEDNIEIVRNLQGVDLQNPLLLVHHISTKAVLTIHNRRILWLDNHVNNDDFSYFLVAEKLVDQVSQNVYSLASCVSQCKLAYLGELSIVSSIDDVPATESLNSNKGRSETSRKLNNLAGVISPPEISKNSETLQLGFTVWTRVKGNVFKIQCDWDGTNFDYSGSLLETAVGDYVMLR